MRIYEYFIHKICGIDFINVFFGDFSFIVFRLGN